MSPPAAGISSAFSTEQIFHLVPQQVVLALAGGGEVVKSLADFQTDYVRGLCFSTLFPELVDSLKGAAVRMAGSEMVPGGMSVDSGVPPPTPAPPGDYPAPPTDRGTT